MSRLLKKLDKRAANLLIASGLFDLENYDHVNNVFWTTDYWGESNEISPWHYLQDFVIQSNMEYEPSSEFSGLWVDTSAFNWDTSIIKTIREFRRIHQI